jgi:hypothetical protein
MPDNDQSGPSGRIENLGTLVLVFSNRPAVVVTHVAKRKFRTVCNAVPFNPKGSPPVGAMPPLFLPQAMRRDCLSANPVIIQRERQTGLCIR